MKKSISGQLQILKTRTLKNGSLIIYTDMSKKLLNLFYKEALKDTTITVNDLLFQQKSCKDSLKQALVGAYFVKLLERSCNQWEVKSE